ncbi:AroM family protein [Paenibacillus macerans]|uniref:AroM family protein n=1 Tax=Paenibacillus macerans TaxID=44252 RepID=UPI00203B6595|nr:AroM family protein [Paenibacillus macerans]MCM3699167.1 AroM family protein [Paenibacillus macerans]
MIRTGLELVPKLGMITIGQAPRTDVAPFLLRQLDGRAELVQAGLLDGWSLEAIEAELSPADSSYMLTSRLADGQAVVVARDKIMPLLQRKIADLEAQGIRHILLLCTGVFPDLQAASAHLIEPDRVLTPAVAALVGNRRLGVICPLPGQADALQAKFAEYGIEPVFAAASPYTGNWLDFAAAAKELKGRADVLLLDCMGYTEGHRNWVTSLSGLPTILSSSLMSKLVSEVIA